MKKLEGVRVRFAPSPTGTLHIGGIRTALYNYLFARQNGGRFLLRVEDTDQNRYVPGAEEYIIEALKWAGITPDEGVGFGGDEGPYRQSDRMHIYKKYAIELVKKGLAYYAFDTPEVLEARRAVTDNFTYNYASRMGQENSLSLLKEQVRDRLESKVPYVIRLKVTPGRAILINDLIRGEVILQSDELDDKVLLKADGLPTYHLANVVDDHLMRISHVIRGEEWLPSTGHHVLLYEAFGWEDTMPRFAHLPLIMKPVGNGKLSKRDGAKFGMPVFPLSRKGETEEDNIVGFRETGFLPAAMLNFLALLGWHPGNDQEIFSLDELVEAFSFEHISKSGARYDYEKAKWFNQKYLQLKNNADIAHDLAPMAAALGYTVSMDYLEKVVACMKERVVFHKDILADGYYFFEPVRLYDEEAMKKRWAADKKISLDAVINHLEQQNDTSATEIEEKMKHFMQESGIKGGDILPLFRLALAGTMKGPGVFEMMEVLGKSNAMERLRKFSNLPT